MTEHILKIDPYYFEAVEDGRKTFELRKDDRAFEVGDTLILCEYRKLEYTGNTVHAEVTYILRDCPEYGLKEGYAILGIRTLGGERND